MNVDQNNKFSGMKPVAPELNPAILSNPTARRAYFDQRRADTAAREAAIRRMNAVNVLTEVTQFEIERATEKPLTSDEFTSLRARIQAVVERLELARDLGR